MKSFCILGVFLLVSMIELEAATSASELSCPKRNLTVTVDDVLRLYIDGTEITGLPNADDHDQPDVVDLPCTAKLIAIHGRNFQEVKAWNAGGILASTDDEYVLTNSTWKCSNVSQFGWEGIDFDDSAWMPPVEYGHNGNSSLAFVPSISLDAAWIWLRQESPTSKQVAKDVEVYCRKRLAPSYCLSSPCAFGGTCIDEPNGGYCICAPGYSGQNCSDEINYCESVPCLNGGSCEPIIVNGYVCQCSPGYTDDNCEEAINYCESIPCVNGGSCLPIVNGYVCQCQPGYTDDHCEEG